MCNYLQNYFLCINYKTKMPFSCFSSFLVLEILTLFFFQSLLCCWSKTLGIQHGFHPSSCTTTFLLNTFLRLISCCNSMEDRFGTSHNSWIMLFRYLSKKLLARQRIFITGLFHLSHIIILRAGERKKRHHFLLELF